MDDEPYIDIDDDDLKRFLARKDLVHFVAMYNRPGFEDCSQTLEKTHYKPGTPANEKFHLHVVKWFELAFFILSIPTKDKHHMSRCAAANGLHLVKGWPNIITSTGTFPFPWRAPGNMYTLENVPNHPVYKNQNWKH